MHMYVRRMGRRITKWGLRGLKLPQTFSLRGYAPSCSIVLDHALCSELAVDWQIVVLNAGGTG